MLETSYNLFKIQFEDAALYLSLLIRLRNKMFLYDFSHKATHNYEQKMHNSINLDIAVSKKFLWLPNKRLCYRNHLG